MTEMIYWNPDAWCSKSNNALEQREKEWQFISQNLKAISSTEFKGKFLNHHKKLFFEGAVDDENLEQHGGQVFQFLLPLFVLWYHPNLNENAVDKVIDWGCREFGHALTMCKCRDLVQKISWYSNEFPQEYGLFGGREEKIVAALWGKPIIGTRFDQVQPKGNEGGTLSQKMLIDTPLSAAFWGSILKRLLNGDKFKTDYGQYLFKHAMAISHKITSPVSVRSIHSVASNIFYFDDSHRVDKDNQSSQEIRDIMLTRYEKGELHEAIQKIWDEAKNTDPIFDA